MEHKIDATNKRFGRLATQVVVLLRGKNKPDFEHQILPKEKVLISNIGKAVFSGKKPEQKTYYHYSGYPGGMKARVLGKEFKKNPGKVFKATVYGMLPKNRQRDKIIRNLTFE